MSATAPNGPPPQYVVHQQAGRGRGRGRLLRVLLACVVVASFGTVGTWAAWTVADPNANNTFSTSTVLLQDNQGGQAGSATSSGSAMFTVSGMSPGSAATTKCIGVVFSGAAASTMTLSATLGGGGAAALGPQLTMDVAQYNTTGAVAITGGTDTNSGSCASYPAGGPNTTIGVQTATLTAWAAGGPYSIAGPVSNTWYQFTVSGLPGGATNCATYCNQSVTVSLTWTLTTV